MRHGGNRDTEQKHTTAGTWVAARRISRFIGDIVGAAFLSARNLDFSDHYLQTTKRVSSSGQFDTAFRRVDQWKFGVFGAAQSAQRDVSNEAALRWSQCIIAGRCSNRNRVRHESSLEFVHFYFTESYGSRIKFEVAIRSKSFCYPLENSE